MTVEQFKGQAMVASLRQPAWMGLSNAYTVDKPLPVKQFAKRAKLLGWNVRKQDLQELLPEANFAREIYLNVRDNPITGGIDVLGPVGRVYENFQVEEMLDVAQAISKQYRAETMGSVGSGTVFMVFAHPDDIVLDPNGGADTIKRYFMLHKAMDGTAAFSGRKTNTRPWCSNTLNIALHEYPAELTSRHTKSMRDRIAAAVSMLSFAEKYDAAFEAEMQALYAREMANAEFDKYLQTLYPAPDESKGKGSATQHTRRVDELWSVWKGETGSMDNLPNNAWRAWNAVTEHNQWFRRIREGNTDNAYAAGAGFDRLTSEFRQHSLSVLQELVAA